MYLRPLHLGDGPCAAVDLCGEGLGLGEKQAAADLRRQVVAVGVVVGLDAAVGGSRVHGLVPVSSVEVGRVRTSKVRKCVDRMGTNRRVASTAYHRSRFG